MELIVLQSGRTRAPIAPEAGGRVVQLEINDGGTWLPLLHAPRHLERTLAEPTAWCRFPMVPWPNRIDGGRFVWRGRLYEVPRNDGVNAIHGLGAFQPWRVEHATARSCRISTPFDRRWPFGGRAVQRISVHEQGITQRIEVHAASMAFPAGAGWHPWFRRDVRPESDVRLLVDASHTYQTAEMIPTGGLWPVAGDLDLRGYPAVCDRRLDTCFRHPRGALRIRWADLELAMTSSRNVTHALVYTPAQAICLEPQTCAIDAFNLEAQGVAGVGVAVVEPGRPLVATTTWRWSSACQASSGR